MYLNIFDSHTHSDTSWDAEHSITFLCETAVKKGILGFAITDHCEINEYVTRDIETRIRQGYFEMLKARAAFGKSLMLSYGIELGQMNFDLDLTHHVLEMEPYDFVLGSLHCIRGNEDFYFMDFQDEDPYALLEEYYQELYEIARLNLFDSMAHITYPIRYMNGKHHLGVDLSRMDDLIDLTLRTLAQNGRALEINTSGLRGPIVETSPTLKYVKRGRFFLLYLLQKTAAPAAANLLGGIVMDRLLSLLQNNARLTNKQLAVMLGREEEDVAKAIAAYEKSGVIRGYQAVIDWDKTDSPTVFARIEIKVTPKKDFGFEEIARTIMELEEVQSVSLMSGGYDLALTVSGKTFRDIAIFVAHRLSPIDSVNSTATHFILKKYKERGVVFEEEVKDERRMTLL